MKKKLFAKIASVVTVMCMLIGAIFPTAVYAYPVNTYRVTWLNYDGSTLEIDEEVPDGQVPTFDHAAPTRKANAQYTYTFAGWATQADQTSGTAAESLPAVAGSNVTYYAAFERTVNTYTVTWINGNETLETDTGVAYGAHPSYDGETPKREAADNTFVFAGWATKNGQSVGTAEESLPFVDGNEVYYAAFRADGDEYVVGDDAVNTYSIKWYNWNGELLHTDVNVQPGEMPVYDGETPTKASDAKYDYEFEEWIPGERAANGDQSYTASFKANIRSYDITFANIDGNGASETITYEYGQMPSHTASKAADQEHKWTFEKWDHAISSVTKDDTYTAIFREVTNAYKITWVNWDDTQLCETYVEYGQLPSYPFGKPVKETDDAKVYEFDSWTPEIVPVVGDATYKAVYRDTPHQYKIRFENWDGRMISEEMVNYNEDPTIPADPSRPSTQAKSFTFAGWSPEVVKATADATYVATYEPTTLTYEIKWIDYDGTVLETDPAVPFGSMPEYNGDEPSHDVKGLTFNGWTPIVTKVVGNQTYKATYVGTQLINPDTQGSITLYKYRARNGQSQEGTGYLDETAAQIVNEPEEGALFAYTKVADLQQITLSDGTTGIYFVNLDSSFRQLFEEYGVALVPDETEQGVGYFSNTLQDALIALTRKTATAAGTGITGETAINNLVTANTKNFPLTDENGQAMSGNVEQGLYLIVEKEVPHYVGGVYNGEKDPLHNNETERTAFSKASPSLISIPMTNLVEMNGHAPGTVWQYDVTVYPKNAEMNIRKDWVADGNDIIDARSGVGGSEYAERPENGNTYADQLVPGEGDNGAGLPDDAGNGRYDDNFADTTRTQDGLTTQIDKNVGDVVTAVISLDIPMLQQDDENDNVVGAGEEQGTVQPRGQKKLYTELVVSDTMSKGLTLRPVDRAAWGENTGTDPDGNHVEYGIKVTLGGYDWDSESNQTLEFGTDYKITVVDDAGAMPLIPKNADFDPNYMTESSGVDVPAREDGSTVLIVELTAAGLEKVNSLTTDSYLYLKYTSMVDKDAAEETGGIKMEHNYAEATVSTDRNPVTKLTSNDIKLYTYEIDLTKEFSDKSTSGPIDYTQAKFSVDSWSPARQVANGWEPVVINDPEHDGDLLHKGAIYTDANEVDLKFVEEAPGIYHLAEPDEEGAVSEVSPAADGTLKLKGLDARTYVITEDATVGGYNLLRDQIKVYMIQDDTNVGSADGTPEDGTLDAAYIQSGNDAAQPISTDIDNGVVAFRILNNEVVTPLRTGGPGWKALPFIGCGLAMAGAFVVILYAKKRREEVA